MEIKVADTDEMLSVAGTAFGSSYNEALVQQAVTAYLAGGRRGSKAQKNRSEVSGGGAKPWRQKGTGRARAGTIRSPLWRGGGVTFAARSSKNYQQKLNKKMYRGAMRSILSELARQDRLVVVERFVVDTHRTKQLLSQLSPLAGESVLIVTDEIDKNLYLASRNLKNIDITEVGDVGPVNLLRFDKVLLTVAAIKQIETWLA